MNRFLNKRIIILLILLCSVLLSQKGFTADCINLSATLPEPLQKIFDKYTDTKYSTSPSQGVYEMCFTEKKDINKVTSGYKITVADGDHLKISGLNLVNSNLQTPLLILTGPITIINGVLSGVSDSQGTAIQIVSGPSTSLGTGSATISSLACSNFAQCINVAKGANVKLEKNTFTISDLANAVVFDASVASPADSTLIGKKENEDDPPKVISVTGKLNLDNCAGSVEMYYEPTDKLGLQISYYPTAVCSVANLEEDVTLKFADDHEEIISKGLCAFKCKDFTEDLSTKVTFTYTSSPDLKVGTTGATTPFVPMPIQKFSDLPDVIFTSAIPDYLPPSGAAGNENTGSTIYVPPVNPGAGDGMDKIDSEKLFIDTGDQTSGSKEQDLADNSDTGGGDDPNATIGSGASSASSLCTLITSANSPQAMPLLIWLMGLPAILACRIKKRF